MPNARFGRFKVLGVILKYRAYLFDMDGVVLDSMRFHVSAWKRAFLEFGLKVEDKILYLYEGAIEPGTAVELFSQNGCTITESDFEKILSRQKLIFRDRYRHRVRPYPEISRILQYLKDQGCPAALVTSSHMEILGAILPRQVMRLFDCIITGDSVQRRKPFPDPYSKAPSALCIPPEEAVAVENAPSGIYSAKGAGTSCIAITTTLGPEYLKGADIVVNNHKELFDIINNYITKTETCPRVLGCGTSH